MGTTATSVPRPLAVTIIAWLFIVSGSVGLIYHLPEFRDHPPLETALICAIRLLAVVGGVFILRRCNWARWLLVLWMAYHVGLSFFHDYFELLVHALLFGVITLFLFRGPAARWFGGNSTG